MMVNWCKYAHRLRVPRVLGQYAGLQIGTAYTVTNTLEDPHFYSHASGGTSYCQPVLTLTIGSWPGPIPYKE